MFITSWRKKYARRKSYAYEDYTEKRMKEKRIKRVTFCMPIGIYDEVKKLAAVPTQIVSPQASRPVMGLVQDSLLAVYRITKEDRPDYHYMNLMNVMHLTGWLNTYQGMLPIPTGTSESGQLTWNGQTVMSSYFPKISYLRQDDDNRLLIQDGKIV